MVQRIGCGGIDQREEEEEEEEAEEDEEAEEEGGRSKTRRRRRRRWRSGGSAWGKSYNLQQTLGKDEEEHNHAQTTKTHYNPNKNTIL